MFSSQQAQGIAQLFVSSLEHEMQTTKRVLASLPEDKLEYKPGEKGWTARELASHIVDSDLWFAKGIAACQFGPFPEDGPAKSVADLISKYDSQLSPLLEKIKGLDGEALAKPTDFMGVFNLPLVLYLQFMSNHSIHHRGQLSTYLRAMGARVPSIYGGSADEPFEMPATA